jgi:hypothetical protein
VFTLCPKNVFAEKLGDLGLDPYVMLVVDLMHEFELGVWKAIFIHLLRILYAAAPGGRLITELNRRQAKLLYSIRKANGCRRFRLIPTFGSTIRRFSRNSAEMKKLAARDFEDLLQVTPIQICVALY